MASARLVGHMCSKLLCFELALDQQSQVFTKKGQCLFFTNYLAACTDCQGCNTSICTPSRNRLVSSVHFDQFDAQNLRNVNGKCVENARKDLKNAHISAKLQSVGWEICT
jgi:hypothetical protein